MAEAELRERLVRVERKSYRRPKALTFEQYAETWYAEGQYSRGWKPKTVTAYRKCARPLPDPVLRADRLESIRPRDVAAFVRDMATRPHGRFNRPLSANYANLLLNVLHAIYDKALGEELVQANPVVGVQRPKVQRRHRSMATTRQYVHLAGVVFRDEAALLEQRLLGVQDLGTNSPPMAPLSQEA